MGGPYPNDQGNPAGAIPAWEAPPPNLQSANFAADTLGAQLDPNPGVFRGLVVGTAGTASSAILYDGTSAVVTMNLHSPATITWVGHPFQPGDAVFFTTTGHLYTGLVAGTLYYVSVTAFTANSFQVADTQSHALAGTNSVNTSVTEAGVQTAWNASVPLGTFDTTAVESLTMPAGGLRYLAGLILTTASSGAANLTVAYY